MEVNMHRYTCMQGHTHTHTHTGRVIDTELFAVGTPVTADREREGAAPCCY
jgi:hypothetical protein